MLFTEVGFNLSHKPAVWAFAQMLKRNNFGDARNIKPLKPLFSYLVVLCIYMVIAQTLNGRQFLRLMKLLRQTSNVLEMLGEVQMLGKC